MGDIERVDFNEHFDQERKQKAQENFNACQHQLHTENTAHWYCKMLRSAFVFFRQA